MDRVEIVAPIAATLLSLVLLFGAGLGGWQGSPDVCVEGDQCFCERDRGGLVRQPANTLSNSAFILAGLIIGASALRRRRSGARLTNPMTATRFFPAFYASLAALLGPGSMALHASLTSWGGALDILSMNVFITFIFFYALVRWRGISAVQFAVGYIVVNAILITFKIYVGHGDETFGVLVVLALLAEVRAQRMPGRTAEWRWLAAAVGLFLAAFGIWLPSQNGGALCDPDSLLQGHALWHVLCAGSTLAIYAYARSEHSVSSTSAPQVA